MKGLKSLVTLIGTIIVLSIVFSVSLHVLDLIVGGMLGLIITACITIAVLFKLNPKLN
jgi:hypothetical protein